MWPFHRPPVRKPRTALRRVVAGLIIGGAIGSIIGKKIVTKMRKEVGAPHPGGPDEELRE